MSLQEAKLRAEEITIAKIIGKGYRANWWHFEDEPSYQELQKRVMEKQHDLMNLSLIHI